MKSSNVVDLSFPFDLASGQLRPETAAPAGTKNRAGSPVLNHLSQQWASMSGVQKAAWNTINSRIPTADNPGGVKLFGINGWSAFYSCNSALMAASLPIVHAPGQISVPAALPSLSVQIITLNSVPVITLKPTLAYPAGPTLALWATYPVPMGNSAATSRASGPYFFVTTITGGLPTTGVDIASEFLATFLTIPAGCKFGFRLMAINPGGYHSPYAYASGVSPADTAAANAGGGGEPGLHMAGE